MDTVLCSMQTGTSQNQAMRSRPLRMRMGMVTAMGIVIEYYIPEKFRKRGGKWTPPEERGKVIPFPAPEKKSA